MKFKTSVMLGSSLLLASIVLSGCNSSNKQPEAPVIVESSDIPVTLTDQMRNRSFALTDEESKVLFIFDAAAQSDVLTAQGITDLSTITTVEIRGSFNGWNSTEDRILTASTSEDGVWFLQVDEQDINIPGNSGQPEYKFVVTVGESTTAWIEVNQTAPDGYQFLGNHLVVSSADNIDTIIANEKQAKTKKTLADFDLTLEADQKMISNFRQVPGVSQLFRSYHPFKQSRPTQETEVTRVAYVNTLMADYGIQSVITLSGDETADLVADIPEVITSTMQSIIDANNDFFIDIDYNLVYYRSNTAEFGAAVKDIVEFMIDDSHPAPFLVHCRLGTDRTGVISGMLAAIAGSSWDDIAADYQQTNQMGIGEFRDYGLLTYSLTQMLGTAPDSDQLDLQAAVQGYFVSEGYLTQDQINLLVSKLTTSDIN